MNAHAPQVTKKDTTRHYTFKAVCTVALSAQPRFYLHCYLLRFTPDSELCSPPSRQGVDRHKHDRDGDEGRCRQSQGSRLTAARSAAQDCECGQGPECKFSFLFFCVCCACSTLISTATSSHPVLVSPWALVGTGQEEAQETPSCEDDTETDAQPQVRLVAVSKLKPANDILALHREPTSQLHFGENYAQELGQKAELLPRSIRWHFIGGLQSTHCKTLAKIPNLFAVSSVDSAKKAQLLNKARGELIASSSSGPEPVPRLNVHVQVNTSGEESKSGAAPGADVVALSRLVLAECPHLNLLGFMTIGAIARSVATTPENENEDFVRLKEQRDLVAAELADLLAARGDGGEAQPLELSMGMSEDFEGAIALGSGEVRVGSTIFGTRGPKSEAKILV